MSQRYDFERYGTKLQKTSGATTSFTYEMIVGLRNVKKGQETLLNVRTITQ